MAPSNGEQVMDFKPVDYDIDSSVANCAAGQYEAVVDKLRIGKSSDGYPRVWIDWKMEEAADEENAQSVGAIVSDMITFYPEGDRKGNFSKRNLRKLCDDLEIERSTVPSRITKIADFDDLKEALVGQRKTIWVRHTPSKDDPNTVFENVGYAAPRDQAGGETEEEETETRGKGKGAKKSAKGRR